MRVVMTGLLAVAVLGLGAAAVQAAETKVPDAAVKTAEQLREAALADTTAWELVRDLTTEIGPRLAGSPNDQRARDWMVARFKALGFDKVWTEPVSWPKWVRRHESGAIVSPYPQPLVLTALGYTAATPAGGLTAQVIRFADLDALKNADPATVKGRIVYVGQRMERHKDGRDYGIGSAIRSGGPTLAAEKGAAAYLLRSAGTDANQRIAHTGMTGFKDPAMAIPAAALSNPDADQLERILASGKEVTVHLDLDVGNEGEYTGANVIAELTGSERPDEVVVMGGHLDSWDLGTGAIDDAAGVGIATGAAHLIAQLPQRPKRSIRVVAFANEESGLWGGRAYAEQHKDEIARHILGSESDLGAGRVWQMSASVKPEARAAIAQIAAVLAPLGVAYDADKPGWGGPDFSPMRAQGMAALSLNQDATYYFDWHHTANDTLDKVDPDDLAQNVAVYAVFSWMAAEAEGDFGSAPGAFADEPRR